MQQLKKICCKFYGVIISVVLALGIVMGFLIFLERFFHLFILITILLFVLFIKKLKILKLYKVVFITTVILCCPAHFALITYTINHEGCRDIAIGLHQFMEIGADLHRYAMKHNDFFPNKIEQLYPEYFSDKEFLKTVNYIPGYKETDNPDAIILYDKEYCYHTCSDKTQIRVLHLSGIAEILNIGEKNFYHGRIRKILFWRFLRFPYRDNKPHLEEIEKEILKLKYIKTKRILSQLSLTKRYKVQFSLHFPTLKNRIRLLLCFSDLVLYSLLCPIPPF